MKGFNDTEEFIENYFEVDIRYRLTIDCEVKQNGFRNCFLRSFLLQNKPLLKIKRSLDFFVKETNCPKPYKIYWKVKNVGKEAIEHNDIRGQIIKDNKSTHHETTKFFGPHYVECYLVKNGVCVARDRIEVPIGHDE